MLPKQELLLSICISAFIPSLRNKALSFFKFPARLGIIITTFDKQPPVAPAAGHPHEIEFAAKFIALSNTSPGHLAT